MKKVFYTTAAFTLVELIVSSLLVAVVVLGIININMVLSNNNQDYGQRYLVRSETQVTLNHILNNVALGMGSANANDEAVLYQGNDASWSTSNPDTFCIHQQPNGNNQWLCYTWSPGPSYQINWCTETYSSGADPRGAASCPSGSNYLGTAYANPTVSFNTNGQSLFSISIQNYLNNAGSTSDPVNNPGVTLSGSATPLQAST